MLLFCNLYDFYDIGSQCIVNSFHMIYGERLQCTISKVLKICWGLARTTAATGRGSGAPTPGEGYFGEWFAHLPGRARSFRWWEISNNKNTEYRRRTCRKTCRMWMSCLKLLRCFNLLRHQAINQSRQSLFLLSSVEFGSHHRTMGQQEPWR